MEDNHSSAPIKLNRVLGRGDLMAISVGLIIGAGIITLTGTAIDMTGRSVCIAFILAALIMALSNVPFAYIGSTVRLNGGQYTQLGLLAPKPVTGIYLYTNVFAAISLSMYGISFATYLFELVPTINVRLVALIALTSMFLVNFFGIKGVAKVEVVMVLVLTLALVLFVAFGLPAVKPAYFEPKGFFGGGVGGILTAAALLTFAADGAKSILNFSGECKNPTKDIPFVMTFSTLVVGALYAVIGVVASGVLPVSEVAGKPLSLVAYEIMPYPVYVFFVVGGALLALLTTINATIGYMTKPLIQACKDGWLPKGMAVLHKKYKSPYIILFVFFIVSAVPVVFGFDTDMIANSTVILLRTGIALLCFYTVNLPKALPEQWARSPRHVGNGRLKFMCILTGVLSLFQVVALATDCTPGALIANGVMLVAAVALAVWRSPKVTMTISYEDCN